MLVSSQVLQSPESWAASVEIPGERGGWGLGAAFCTWFSRRLRQKLYGSRAPRGFALTLFPSPFVSRLAGSTQARESRNVDPGRLQHVVRRSQGHDLDHS